MDHQQEIAQILSQHSQYSYHEEELIKQQMSQHQSQMNQAAQYNQFVAS
jgi:hypothetical protein